jgi:hypothetical protein
VTLQPLIDWTEVNEHLIDTGCARDGKTKSAQRRSSGHATADESDMKK